MTNLLRSRESRKTVAEVNLRHPELGGVVGNPIDKHGVPFSLTEEFVEVYRLHSLLPEAIELRRYRDDSGIERVPMPMTRQAGSSRLSWPGEHDGSPVLLRQAVGRGLELNNFPRFLQELSVPGHPVLDLGAIDILRARERGVPRYNEFRRQLLLKPIRTFRDLTDDEEQLGRLEAVYGGDVEALDLLIGTLAEQSTESPANRTSASARRYFRSSF